MSLEIIKIACSRVFQVQRPVEIASQRKDAIRERERVVLSHVSIYVNFIHQYIRDIYLLAKTNFKTAQYLNINFSEQLRKAIIPE